MILIWNPRRHLSAWLRVLRLGADRRKDRERGYEPNAYDYHAATVVCWRSTVAIFRQPSILRNLIGPAIR